MGMRQWVEWPARYWIGLALIVWIARAVIGALGNESAGPLLAVISAVLLAVGVARAVMDWLATNSSPGYRPDDDG